MLVLFLLGFSRAFIQTDGFQWPCSLLSPSLVRVMFLGKDGIVLRTDYFKKANYNRKRLPICYVYLKKYYCYFRFVIKEEI